MKSALIRDSVLRVGEVIAVEGRKIFVLVDKNKNASDLLLNGEVIKNISVGSFVEIRKGFLSLIGKIDGEKLKNENFEYNERITISERNCRILTISLSGYVDSKKIFIGGIKELPLIGNEAFVLTDEKIQQIHSLTKVNNEMVIDVASTDFDDTPVKLPIDGLFNSHIAVFGNTGSGKSNTLAALYQSFFSKIGDFKQCKSIFFDFNGEYIAKDCLTQNKTVYNLSTRKGVSKLPVTFKEIFSIETLSILVEATEKTQKPFLVNVLNTFEWAHSSDCYGIGVFLKGRVEKQITKTLKMANKEIAYRLLDYLEAIYSFFVDEKEVLDNISSDLTFFKDTFKTDSAYFDSSPENITKTNLYKASININQEKVDLLPKYNLFIIFLYVQLIDDLHRHKVNNDHIYPVINRIRSRQASLENIFDICKDPDVWGGNNVIVINLRDVNIDMRKTIPLLLAKELYTKHKKVKNETLNIIVDEAHNILSKGSFRETADWKDYRLETFEEIIKEGRKFGVFLTICSQRPNDISETIISQAHNYFIHQLINQRDLQTIGNAVSYIDKITEESIPTLSVGTCIFSGIASSMPFKLKIAELPDSEKPDSHTIKISSLLKKNQGG